MQSEKVVMTNGCFDLLHIGHITYLQQAKALGDRLIVAVNSNESVKILKGDSRPINDLQARMAVLAALECVDWVVSFNEETPQRLYEKVLPDVLVKGGDYKISDVVGGGAVIANGGEVKILEFVAGHSTSNMIAKARNANKN
jgi:D-beta-D-heptose 7-phosphate kinase/D-beta-D-heptose 1-phosphate adenosyltransferase